MGVSEKERESDPKRRRGVILKRIRVVEYVTTEGLPIAPRGGSRPPMRKAAIEAGLELSGLPTVKRPRITVEEVEMDEDEVVEDEIPATRPSKDKRDLMREERERLAAAAASPKSTSTRTREQLAELQARYRALYKRLNFFERQRRFEDAIKRGSNADVVFMVDCTGSMDPYIKKTKSKIKAVITDCAKRYRNKIRVGFVGYRDHCDTGERITSHQLTEHTKDVVGFMEALEADGGGDECEDVFGGLEEVLLLDWKNPIRVLIHIGDAPQHGSRFHKGAEDTYASYNKADPRGLKVEDLLTRLKERKINYFFGKINNSTDVMIREFRKVMKDDEDFIQEIDIAKPDSIHSMIVSSISSSIDDQSANILSTSIRSDLFAHCELKKFSIVKEKPDLKSADPVEVMWLDCTFPPTDLSKIRECINNTQHSWKKEVVRMAANPFAKGDHRLSYHGTKGNEDIVIKDFQFVKRGGKDFREECIKFMETQGVAALLAAEFNKVAPPNAEKVDFIKVSVIETRASNGTPVYYNAEKLLEEKYVKWRNNTDYVNKEQFAATLDAFCHWTHDVTDGYLMVVDIQGIEGPDGFVLTDPCIHCKDFKFGSTNFGETGMKSFFMSHRCNQICKELKLKPGSKCP